MGEHRPDDTETATTEAPGAGAEATADKDPSNPNTDSHLKTISNDTDFVPRPPRPFDDLKTPDEQRDWGMKEYQELSTVDPEDGLTFANKTAQMIAYERYLESEKPEKERICNDFLAKHFKGKYGKRVSDVLACFLQPSFDKDMVGLKYEGHIQYTAARTRLISEKLGEWADTVVEGGVGKSIEGEDGAEVKSGDGESRNLKESASSKPDAIKQVVNLGAGVDTRAFWDEALRKCALYVEVDTAEVNEHKSDVLEGLRKQKLKEKRAKEQRLKESPGETSSELDSSGPGLLLDSNLKLSTICKHRAVVSMDFSKESVKDLPKDKEAGFDPLSPTCWILEGLVMYLTREDNIKMLEEISSISSKGSYLILNFVANQPACNPDDHDDLLKENGWVQEERLMFGDAGFNFGKYPPNQKPNETYGFSFYRKIRFASGYWTGEGNGREWVSFGSK